jgi:putative endonuclease
MGLFRRGKAKTRKELAQIGEDHAARFLASKGYRIKERNYRTRAGEVDLIAEQDDTLVFIEVKARSSNDFGSPVEAVTPWKQRTIARLAASYLSLCERRERLTRYDIVAVYLTPQGRVTKIEVLQGAFGG